jgi:hypothetical protein
MKRVLLVGAGLLLVLAGVIFTLQGSGAMGGDAMSGVTFWAVAGPVIALVGLVLAILGLRGGRVRPGRHDQARSRQA